MTQANTVTDVLDSCAYPWSIESMDPRFNNGAWEPAWKMTDAARHHFKKHYATLQEAQQALNEYKIYLKIAFPAGKMLDYRRFRLRNPTGQ